MTSTVLLSLRSLVGLMRDGDVAANDVPDWTEGCHFTSLPVTLTLLPYLTLYESACWLGLLFALPVLLISVLVAVVELVKVQVNDEQVVSDDRLLLVLDSFLPFPLLFFFFLFSLSLLLLLFLLLHFLNQCCHRVLSFSPSFPVV